MKKHPPTLLSCKHPTRTLLRLWSCRWSRTVLRKPRETRRGVAQLSTGDCAQPRCVLTPVLLLKHALFLAAKDAAVAGATWRSGQQGRRVLLLLLGCESSNLCLLFTSSCGASRLKRRRRKPGRVLDAVIPISTPKVEEGAGVWGDFRTTLANSPICRT